MLYLKFQTNPHSEVIVAVPSEPYVRIIQFLFVQEKKTTNMYLED